MIDIILNIPFLPEIILLGTFFRKVPITGQNSGKLKFSSILSNVHLDEDSTGITLSTWQTQAVDNREIAFGTGLTQGLTSSSHFKWEADNYGARLIGIGQINPFGLEWTSNCNLNYALYNHSIIINGCCNKIGNLSAGGTFSRNEVIIGGVSQCTISTSVRSGNNVLINGTNSSIDGGTSSIIIGAGGNKGNQSNYNSIINSKMGLVYSAYNSVITSGPNRCFKTTSDFDSNNSLICTSVSSVISSFSFSVNTNECSKIKNQTIISSTETKIISDANRTPKPEMCFNTVLSSNKSLIFGDCNLNNYSGTKANSCFNSLISTWCSEILASKYSTIIGGVKNRLVNCFVGSITNNRQMYSSSILGGYKNCIVNYDLNETTVSRSHSIIGGKGNYIEAYNTLGNTIIGGINNFISSPGNNNSLIISSYKSSISNKNSAIISSSKSYLQISQYSSVISSYKSSPRGPNSIDISNCCYPEGELYAKCGIRISTYKSNFSALPGLIYTYFPNHTNTIIASCNSSIQTNPPSHGESCYNGILGTLTSTIFASCNSAILNSINSKILTNSPRSLIIGSSILMSDSEDSAIISSTCICMYCSRRSAVIGSCNSVLGTSSLVTCNSVILGSENSTLTFSNTTMVHHFNFSGSKIFENLNTSVCTGIFGTFANSTDSIKIIKGFVVS
jgi:hypothetical protein